MDKDVWVKDTSNGRILKCKEGPDAYFPLVMDGQPPLTGHISKKHAEIIEGEPEKVEEWMSKRDKKFFDRGYDMAVAVGKRREVLQEAPDCDHKPDQPDDALALAREKVAGYKKKYGHDYEALIEKAYEQVIKQALELIRDMKEDLEWAEEMLDEEGAVDTSNLAKAVARADKWLKGRT